jgi:hypothetical protein
MKLNEWPFKKPESKENKELRENIRAARFNFTHGFLFLSQPIPLPALDKNAPNDPRKGMPVLICSWERPSPPAEIFYLLHHGLN